MCIETEYNCFKAINDTSVSGLKRHKGSKTAISQLLILWKKRAQCYNLWQHIFCIWPRWGKMCHHDIVLFVPNIIFCGTLFSTHNEKKMNKVIIIKYLKYIFHPRVHDFLTYVIWSWWYIQFTCLGAKCIIKKPKIILNCPKNIKWDF